MGMDTHLAELKKKHETLSEKIEDEQRHPGSDDLVISELKKQKLRIKEEIERIAAGD